MKNVFITSGPDKKNPGHSCFCGERFSDIFILRNICIRCLSYSNYSDIGILHEHIVISEPFRTHLLFYIVGKRAF